MSAWDIFKVSRKTFFYPSAWLDINRIKDFNKAIWSSARDLFIAPAPLTQESFEEATARLGLTEEDIQRSQQSYFGYAILFLMISILLFLFSFYLLFFHHTFAGWLIGLGATAISLGYAFRFHFSYFQIRERKLGCTFDEWRASLFEKSAQS